MVENTREIAPQFGVLNSHDFHAKTRECPISMRVVAGVMVRSVEFDSQASSIAIEIHDEAGNHLLAAKMDAIEPILSQFVP